MRSWRSRRSAASRKPALTPGPSSHGIAGEEAAAAALLFAGAVAAFLLLAPGPAGGLAGVAALGLFALLVGVYFGTSVRSLRRLAAARLGTGAAGAALGPAVLLAAAGVYAAAVGLPVLPRLAAFGAYLLLPTLLVARSRGDGAAPGALLAAALLLWIPIELELLPALPVGFATGFLAWQPDLGATRLPLLLVIFFAIAVPEEFLFRGLMQNLLAGPLGEGRALALASVVFGLAHLPDPRYVLLASVAGVAYGWVYLRTGRIMAAAVTHAAVDWVWALLLGG